MLVDMNSFFASVEQQANPFLRGKPLGVSPSSHPGSCLIGTSKEAKAMGIKNGMPLYKAQKIYPKIIVVESEPEKYREVNRQMNKIFHDYTDRLQTYSVDESFLDLHNSKLNPLVIGSQIKKRIRQEVGEWLTCSIGVAENRFLCKLAADMEKPDGLTVIWREQLKEIYKTKKLTDLWGINRGWTNRLENIGITSPLQLLNYPVQNLISLFGKPGLYIWKRLNGLEKDEIISEDSLDGSAARIGEGLTVSGSFDADELRYAQHQRATINAPKSFGHSWVLNFRTTDKQKLKPAILRLAEKAARRMRRKGFRAYGWYLSVTLVDSSYFRRSKIIKLPIETGFECYKELLPIFNSWKFNLAVMQIAVGFTHLSPKVHQLSLFADKFSNLTPILDQINDKYGEFTIRSGLLTDTVDFAPDAIAFGK